MMRNSATKKRLEIDEAESVDLGSRPDTAAERTGRTRRPAEDLGDFNPSPRSGFPCARVQNRHGEASLSADKRESLAIRGERVDAALSALRRLQRVFADGEQEHAIRAYTGNGQTGKVVGEARGDAAGRVRALGWPHGCLGGGLGAGRGRRAARRDSSVGAPARPGGMRL